MRNIILFLVITSLVSTSGATWGQIGADRLSANLQWRGLLIGTVHSLIIPEFAGLYENIEDIILMNPHLESRIWPIITYFIEFLKPFYLLSLLACGFYIMFISGSIEGRGKAKNSFINLILSMIFVTLSPVIMSLILRLSGAFTEEILKHGPETNVPLDTFNSLVGFFSHSALVSLDGGYLFLILALLLAFGLFAILAFRYLILMVFIILFPVTLFLCTIGITRDVGKRIAEHTINWTFAQSLTAIAFVSINLGMVLLNLNGTPKLIAGVVACIILMISPLILPIVVGRRVVLWA